jgi:pterin-4a-carbinolamine dehydratase
MDERLNASQFLELAPAGWQVDGVTAVATFGTGSFATGVDLVVAIGRLADDANHHPDVLLRYPDVAVTLTTHDAGGLTQRDVDLARAITGSAAAMGVSPQ